MESDGRPAIQVIYLTIGERIAGMELADVYGKTAVFAIDPNYCYTREEIHDHACTIRARRINVKVRRKRKQKEKQIDIRREN